MLMIDSYTTFWVKSFVFGGNTKRSDFWLANAGQLIVVIFLLFLGFLLGALFGDSNNLSLLALLVIYSFASIVPNLSIQVRRLRDAGFSPWLLLLTLIPYVGGLILFILYLQPSKVAAPE
jgi:uncharacterized membrane protein YhaH (DUF805 family)